MKVLKNSRHDDDDNNTTSTLTTTTTTTTRITTTARTTTIKLTRTTIITITVTIIEDGRKTFLYQRMSILSPSPVHSPLWSDTMSDQPYNTLVS